MARVFGVETEFDVGNLPRGGGGGGGAAQPSATSSVSRSLLDLGVGFASLTKDFAAELADERLGGAAKKLVERASLAGNPAQAEVMIRAGVRNYGKSFGLKAAKALKEMIDNPIQSFVGNTGTRLFNTVTGETSFKPHAVDTGPQTQEEVQQVEAEEQLIPFAEASPLLAAGFTRLFKRINKAGNAKTTTSMTDIIGIPEAALRFDEVNYQVNRMHSAAITDTNTDVIKDQQNAIRLASQNKLNNAITDMLGAVAEAPTVALAIRNGTLSVEEAIDLLQDTKDDITKDLNEQGTLANLGMEFKDVNIRIKSIIDVARTSYTAMKAEKADAVKHIVGVATAKVQLRKARFELNMSDRNFAFMLEAPTITAVVAADKASRSADVIRSSGFGNQYSNYIVEKTSWGRGRKGAQQSVADAFSVEPDPSKPASMYTNLSRLRVAVEQYPDMAPDVKDKMEFYVKWAQNLSIQNKGKPDELRLINNSMALMWDVLRAAKVEAGRRQGQEKFDDTAARALADLLNQATESLTGATRS